MTLVHESAASLGFFGDDLEPSVITMALGAEPTVGVRKGEVWRTRSGVEKIATRGSWRITIDRRAPGDLDGQINALLDGLSDNLPAWRSFASRYRGRVFCGLFMVCGNEMFTLASSTLARLGERGLLLDFDVYSPV